MRSKYIQRYDGQEIPIQEVAQYITKSGRVAYRKYHITIACCDCGLIHEYDFKYERGKLTNTANRNARKTAAYRRYHPVELK